MDVIENMERLLVFAQFLLLPFSGFLVASDSSPIKGPQSPTAAGVFMLIDGGKYTFNFTAARAACMFLNVSIATRSQMERALQHGLETCKFGWTAEQVAVIPRLTSDKNCGKGKTGVVTWLTTEEKRFGVFCFNASDFEESSDKSTASLHSFTYSTPLTAPLQTSTPAKPIEKSTTKHPTLETTATATASKSSYTSAFTLLFKATHSTVVPSTSNALKTFSTPIPTSISQISTFSKKPSLVTFAFFTAQNNWPVSSESVESTAVPSLSPAKPLLGDAPTAVIVLGIILILLIAAGVVWYYKVNIFTLWPQGQQKDDSETEMWKHTGSEMDVHSHEEEKEDESDRKYSSDFTLCVNQVFKANSSE